MLTRDDWTAARECADARGRRSSGHGGQLGGRVTGGERAATWQWDRGGVMAVESGVGQRAERSGQADTVGAMDNGCV